MARREKGQAKGFTKYKGSDAFNLYEALSLLNHQNTEKQHSRKVKVQLALRQTGARNACLTGFQAKACPEAWRAACQAGGQGKGLPLQPQAGPPLR